MVSINLAELFLGVFLWFSYGSYMDLAWLLPRYPSLPAHPFFIKVTLKLHQLILASPDGFNPHFMEMSVSKTEMWPMNDGFGPWKFWNEVLPCYTMLYPQIPLWKYISNQPFENDENHWYHTGRVLALWMWGTGVLWYRHILTWNPKKCGLNNDFHMVYGHVWVTS